jgi:hypothetical protein
MQKIKSFIIGLGVLALFLCAFTLLIPGHVTVTRGIEIAAPRDSVQALLEDFHQWPRWCSWMGKDSVVTRKFIAPSPDKEATVTWYPNGQSYNKNFISILQAIPGDIRLYYQFNSLLPASGGFTLTGKGSSTFVEWNLAIKLRWYPWEKISGIAMDKIWGVSMAQSLKNLKALCGDSSVIPTGEAPPGE